MNSFEQRLSDVNEALRALGREVSLDILTPFASSLAATVARDGFPAVLPLWSGELQTVGLLADPSARPEAWAGVLLSRRQGLTLATDVRTVLPQLILHRVLSNLPKTAAALAARWTEIETRVLALNRALGGSDQALRVVLDAVTNPETRQLFSLRPGHEAEFEQAHSDLGRRIDESNVFQRYADWLDACIQRRPRPVESLDTYGPWARRVLCWAQRLRHRYSSALSVPAVLVHQIVEERAGIDSGVPTRPTWGARPGAASGETVLIEAANSIQGEPSSGDPVSEGVVRALVTEGVAYTGYTHAQAVVMLDERGEPERAWQVLQSAAWWMARKTGAVPDPILKAAQSLAERHGWEDVLFVLRRSMESE